MAGINILFLSDIHIGGSFVYEKVQDLSIRICDEIDSSGKRIDMVVTTGDIFDGKTLFGSREETRAYVQQGSKIVR